MHLLLCSRCDPNARNLRRETPLIVAAKQGHVNIVRRLLTYDVELDAKDAEGQLQKCLFSERRFRKLRIAYCMHVRPFGSHRVSPAQSLYQFTIEEQERQTTCVCPHLKFCSRVVM